MLSRRRHVFRGWPVSFFFFLGDYTHTVKVHCVPAWMVESFMPMFDISDPIKKKTTKGYIYFIFPLFLCSFRFKGQSAMHHKQQRTQTSTRFQRPDIYPQKLRPHFRQFRFPLFRVSVWDLILTTTTTNKEKIKRDLIIIIIFKDGILIGEWHLTKLIVTNGSPELPPLRRRHQQEEELFHQHRPPLRKKLPVDRNVVPRILKEFSRLRRRVRRAAANRKRSNNRTAEELPTDQ